MKSNNIKRTNNKKSFGRRNKKRTIEPVNEGTDIELKTKWKMIVETMTIMVTMMY